MAHFTRFVRSILFSVMLFGIAIGLGMYVPAQPAFAQSGGCSISSFSMDPNENYTLGVAINLSGTSNCGTVKFEILQDNQVVRTLSETGQPNQTATWHTNETGSGYFDVCFVARGNTDWPQANRSCRRVYVEGSSAPPPNTNTGTNVRCWVNNFVVNPASAPAGYDFYLSGQGQCDGNARASQFAIFGQPFGEYGGNTASATWSSAGWMPGNVSVCFRITAGDWANMAESCTTITLTDGGTPSNNTTQGPPVTNNQPGQSNQSNPNTSAPPQNNQNQNTTTTNTNQNTQSSSTTSCNSLSRLSIGSVATVSDATPFAVPLRRSASTEAGLLVDVPVLTRLTITAGPTCSGRFVWWQTSYSGQTGWIAEINGRNNYNLIPATTQTTTNRNQTNTTTATVSVCSGNFGLTSGIRAMISTYPSDSNSMRSGAGTANTLLLMIPPGGEIDIISGPRCADGYVWWQVNYNGQTGWTVEGDAGVAWVVRVVDYSEVETEVETFLQENPVSSNTTFTDRIMADLLSAYSRIRGIRLSRPNFMTIASVLVDCGALAPDALEFLGVFVATRSVSMSATYAFSSPASMLGVEQCVIASQELLMEVFR